MPAGSITRGTICKYVTFHAKTYTNAFPLNGLDR